VVTNDQNVAEILNIIL